MSRTARATASALLGYSKFAIAIATGLWLVPFTLRHVGPRMYGYWLASGELLAYASLAEFGVLVTVPWLIADADGRGDRDGMRVLLTNGIAAALTSAAGYLVIATGLIAALPHVVHLDAAERAPVVGAVLIIAIGACLVFPLRVFYCVLVGLQDVRFYGVVDLLFVPFNVVLTAVLLAAGFGLYALALGTAVPQLVIGLVYLFRVGAIAPDLLRRWRIPHWRDVRALFREGTGAWLGGWGWRLISATDGLVLAALGQPNAVTALACTAKLSSALTQLSWVPCDSGLIGLANLAGERQDARLREAIVVLVRGYLALAGATACVVLAVNPAFVSRWVGGLMFAGGKANVLLAIVALAMTFGHALAVVPTALGQRMQIGLATFASGVVHIAFAFGLGWWLGVPGVLLAGVISHGIVFPALAWRPFAVAARMPGNALITDVLRPWLIRFLPLVAVALAIEQTLGVPPLPVVILIGGLVSLASMWHMRPLYLQFGPVRAMYERLFARWTRWAASS
jgi:O-antigen/teichoic acid export membrane protein